MPIPIPMAIDLVFTNMAPTENPPTTMNEMKKNYKKLEEIALDIKNHGLDEYVKFDNNGRYDFFKCEDCDGPMLGHLQTKCRNRDHNYDDRTVKSFEGWLERSHEFRRQVADKKQAEDDRQAHHQAKQAEFQANMLGDTVKRMMEEIGPRDRNVAPTTQLIKARLPPIWTGQKFEKWKVEIEK